MANGLGINPGIFQLAGILAQQEQQKKLLEEQRQRQRDASRRTSLGSIIGGALGAGAGLVLSGGNPMGAIQGFGLGSSIGGSIGKATAKDPHLADTSVPDTSAALANTIVGIKNLSEQRQQQQKQSAAEIEKTQAETEKVREETIQLQTGGPLIQQERDLLQENINLTRAKAEAKEIENQAKISGDPVAEALARAETAKLNSQARLNDEKVKQLQSGKTSRREEVKLEQEEVKLNKLELELDILKEKQKAVKEGKTKITEKDVKKAFDDYTALAKPDRFTSPEILGYAISIYESYRQLYIEGGGDPNLFPSLTPESIGPQNAQPSQAPTQDKEAEQILRDLENNGKR